LEVPPKLKGTYAANTITPEAQRNHKKKGEVEEDNCLGMDNKLLTLWEDDEIHCMAFRE